MHNYWQFLSRAWPLLGFGFFSIFWGNLGQSFFISWFGAPIQASLNLSAAIYGSLYSAATLVASLLLMAFGGVIDRWPLQRFVVLVALGLMAACLVMGFAVNAGLLLLGFFLVRLFGQALMPHTAQTTMARYFDGDRGKALSISASGFPAGEICLPLLAVALIGWLGWRNTWFVLALTIPIIYLPLILWLLRRAGNLTSALATQATSHTSMGRRQMLGDVRFWMLLPAVLSTPFLVTGVFIHQGFILDHKGWAAAWLAKCFIALGIAHWLGSLFSGVLVDLFSARRLLPIVTLPMLASLSCLVFFEGNWVALVFMTLMGFAIGLGGPIFGALWAEVYGTGKLGSIRSLMTSLVILSSALSPVAFGLVVDMGASLVQVYGTCLAALALAGISAGLSYRAYRAPPP